MTNKGRSIIDKCEKEQIPYFVLSAKDEHSMIALCKYIESITTGGMFGNFPCDANFIKDIEEIRRQFIDWRFSHTTKSPD